MRLGYNTNGLAFHKWPESLELLAEQQYRSVAITLDHYCLNPYQPASALREELKTVQQQLEQYDLSCVIETGARFLLDGRAKHEPTLVTQQAERRAKRVDFLCRSIDIASELNADAVSFWAGVLQNEAAQADSEDVWNWLVEGCRQVADYAEAKSVKIAFEPEPGMFIETFEQFRLLQERVNSPLFGLTVDIGHVQCVETRPISAYLEQWADSIYNVHIEDMCRGVHEHLRFGEGEIDFVPVLKTLHEIGYRGGVNVELSRHSHMAPAVLQESREFLQATAQTAGFSLL